MTSPRNPLLALNKLGQSVWLDFITRRFMQEGRLSRLISEDEISGVTSNPSIFEKAIVGGQEYDEAIVTLIREGKGAQDIFDSLSIEDIQRACDLFRPLYDRTNGGDGYVSLEVNPHLSRDTARTLDETRRLFRSVDRPNVMIKIPGTREGLPAVEQALSEGINVNITLIFSLARYQEVMEAWLTGIEKWCAVHRPPCPVASVASFFVSRVDTLVDKLLLERGAGDTLPGKAAIANARLAYGMFKKMEDTPRCKALAAYGVRVQRPLWASTSTKNPKYRDIVYVEELAGPETVNTLPLPTIEATRDHGQIRAALPGNLEEAKRVFQDMARVGIDMDQVTRQLEDDGLKLFSDAYDNMIASLEKKREALKAVAS